MFRFYAAIILNFHYVIIFIIKMKYFTKRIKYTRLFRHQYAQHISRVISKRARITVHSYGKENIPSNNGFVCYPNHQGKFDALAIVQSIDTPVSVLIDKSVCTNPLLNGFLDLTASKKLDKTNARESITIFKEISEEIIHDERNFVIFPEGGYTDNRNHLQTFHTGCLRFLHRTKCPIVPTCLYDTYKPFSGETGKSFCKVECQVHFLKPIYYEEYKDLDKQGIADLIKARIQEKLDEIENNK